MTKEELRKTYRKKRKGLNNIEVEKASIEIHNMLFSRIMMHRFSPIHIFLPIIKNNEINTWPIIETLRKDFSSEIYISKSVETGELLHVKLEKETEMVENKWGISEPKNTSHAISSEEFFDTFFVEDILILIPLLVFDKKGHRVGYGKGYYDRFLSASKLTCTKIGLSYFDAVDNISDLNITDIPLDYCITPERVWSFRN